MRVCVPLTVLGVYSVAKCDTSAYGATPPVQAHDRAPPTTPADVELAWDSPTYPIVHPFGENIHLDEFIRVRIAMGGPASGIIGETKHDFENLRKLRDAQRFVEKAVKASSGVLDGQAKEIYDQLRNNGTVNPHMVTPSVDTYLQPILEQCVENVKIPTSVIVDEAPTVVDAHDTYSNPARFAAEQKAMFEAGVLIVGPYFRTPATIYLISFQDASLVSVRQSRGCWDVLELCDDYAHAR